MKLGAWTGKSGGVFEDKSKKAIALAKRAGISVLDVMVNDGSVYGRQFALYASERQIIDALSPIVDAGLELHITTWVQATPTWLAGMEAVSRIALMTGAQGITGDCEESWIFSARARGLSRTAQAAEAARHVAALRSSFAGPVASTHIIYPGDEVRPFVDACDRDIVQGYAVKKYFSKSAPGRAPFLAADRWYPPGPRSSVVGLAAYDLEGSYGGKTAADVMAIDLAEAARLGWGEARYWRLEHFNDPAMRAALARAREAVA